MRALPPIKAPVCGVFAAALAADVDFNTAMIVARAVRNPPPAWRGRLSLVQLTRILDHLAVRFELRRNEVKPTLANFAAMHDETQHYIVRVSGHVMTLCNGRVYDQDTPHGEPVERSRHRRRYITHVITIH